MADTNNWTLIGRLTADAEGKTLPSSTFVANFSIASETGWGDRKKTNFWKVQYFGQGAAAIIQWLTKGKQVALIGEAQVDKWTGSDGIPRSETVLVARSVQLLASPQGSSGGQGARNPSSSHADDGGDITF